MKPSPSLRFPGQKDNEQIQVLVRKHWIIDVKIGSTFFFLCVVPFAAGVLGTLYFYEGAFTKNMLLGVLAVLLYWLFALVVIYVKWLNEELDVIIVTNERVLSHVQVDLFHREISETSISQVQDVIGIEKGVLGHLFHYGTLKMQTAAHHIVFEIRNVARPYETSRKILDLRDAFLGMDKDAVPPVPSPS